MKGINIDFRVVFFTIFLLPSSLYIVLYAKEYQEFMTTFAKSLGFSFSAKGDINSVDGMLFKTGNSQSIGRVISGLYYNHLTRFFIFNTIVGYGKNRHIESFNVLEVVFDTLLPEIILNRKDSLWGTGSTNRDNEKKLVLEGDFDKYFNLYTISGYETEVLQIFTPEIMSMFINDMKDLNIEIYKNKLYIYTTMFSADMKGLLSFYDLGKDVIINLDTRFESLKGDVGAMEKYVKLT